MCFLTLALHELTGHNGDALLIYKLERWTYLVAAQFRCGRFYHHKMNTHNLALSTPELESGLF